MGEIVTLYAEAYHDMNSKDMALRGLVRVGNYRVAVNTVVTPVDTARGYKMFKDEMFKALYSIVDKMEGEFTDEIDGWIAKATFKNPTGGR